MSGEAVATFLLVLLVLIVALAAATFFRHKVAAMLALLGVPAAIVLHASVGALRTLFVIGAGALVIAFLHTVSDTLRILRAARREPRQPQRNSQPRRSERLRKAA